MRVKAPSKICKDILCHAKVRTSKNNKYKYPKSNKFNKATSHEETKQKAKIVRVANVTFRQMLNCSQFLIGNILSLKVSFLLYHFSVFSKLYLFVQTAINGEKCVRPNGSKACNSYCHARIARQQKKIKCDLNFLT